MDVINDSLVRMTIIETIMKLINEANRTIEPMMVRGEVIKITGISNQLQKLYTEIENYEAPYEKIVKTLEAIVVMFKRRNIKAEELKHLIEQSHHNLVNMGIKYASEDAIARNKNSNDPLTIKELREGYKRELREYTDRLRYMKSPEKERIQLQNFNYSFLINSYKDLTFYPHYFYYNLDLLKQEIEGMISNCSNEQNKKILVEIHRQLQVLLSKAKDPYFNAPQMVTEIETIREKMHQEYPQGTLLCKEFQYIYIKLLDMAKQIACEYTAMTEKFPNKPRTPLLRIINTGIPPKDIYSYIENELGNFGGVLSRIIERINPEDKEKAKYVLTELEELETTLLPYDTFRTNLCHFLSTVKNADISVSSELLKGIFSCIYEFMEKIDRIEIERSNRYLTRNAEDLSGNYDSLNEMLKVEEEVQTSKERQLFEQSLGKDTKCTVRDVNAARNNVMHLQIIIYSIKRYAHINNIELEPGIIKQQITPEG